MTCHEVQTELSLYLYGELDFAREEEMEQHLAECALCQRVLAREKNWHAALNSQQRDVSPELLNGCREALWTALPAAGDESSRPSPFSRWVELLGWRTTRWSARLAVASFLIFLGFFSAKWIDYNGISNLQIPGASAMSLVNSPGTRIRDIQPDQNGQVRITVEQVRERQVLGNVDEDNIQRLLLAAAKDSADPGIRVVSVEALSGQNGADVRDALIYSARRDPNAAVRLKALEGLRPFAGDKATREALKFVLEHDDNPGVRSEAIDVLAPVGQKTVMTPDLAGALQEIMRNAPEDDYVQARCFEMLREAHATLDAY